MRDAENYELQIAELKSELAKVNAELLLEKTKCDFLHNVCESIKSNIHDLANIVDSAVSEV